MIDRFAAALSNLPGAGPARLRVLLCDAPSSVVWARLVAGLGSVDPVGKLLWGDGDQPAMTAPQRRQLAKSLPAALVTSWVDRARRIGPEPPDVGSSVAGVVDLHHVQFPQRLRDDPAAPAIVWWAGDLALLDAATVGIVGTRRATSVGRHVARELGHHLALAGVAVVSGLARGVDAAAHLGALTDVEVDSPCRAIGVVGTGLDRPYPPEHASLWNRIAATGLLLSEAPPGTTPERWRFPSRNRILAGVSDVLVVVESDELGGSMSTVAAAIERGTPVMAVPGSVTNPVARGTNGLLADGCGVVRDARDVLDHLALQQRIPMAGTGGAGRVEPDGPMLPAVWQRILTELQAAPLSTFALVDRLGLGFDDVETAVIGLIERRLVADRGLWLEATG
jgi:DNA processing protein